MRLTILIAVLILKTILVTSQSFDQRLSEIEKVAENINSSLQSFKPITLESEEFMEHVTDGGAELIGYFENDQIRKIKLSIGLSYGMKEFEFYYEGSDLIYVREFLRQFVLDESTGTFDYTKIEMVFRGNYIFKAPFDLITLGHNRFEDDKIDPKLTLNQESEFYRKKLLRAYNKH